MENRSGCLRCGRELIYLSAPQEVTCSECGKVFFESVQCAAGHYICDACHQQDACQVIATFCNTTEQTNPIEMAIELMHRAQIKMHGPEHHFLVPAVLLTAHDNLKKNPELKQAQLETARLRAEKIPGGFCGSHGNCGAGVGSGIFYSVLTETTPLTPRSWQLANLMTGACLVKIAERGGPRCCKRDTFTAIEHAVAFMKTHHAIDIPVTDTVTCDFHRHNQECLQSACPYFPG